MKKPGAISRPGTNQEFAFPNYFESPVRVKLRFCPVAKLATTNA
jgi:hypothetical protein